MRQQAQHGRALFVEIEIGDAEQERGQLAAVCMLLLYAVSPYGLCQADPRTKEQKPTVLLVLSPLVAPRRSVPMLLTLNEYWVPSQPRSLQDPSNTEILRWTVILLSHLLQLCDSPAICVCVMLSCAERHLNLLKTYGTLTLQSLHSIIQFDAVPLQCGLQQTSKHGSLHDNPLW